MNTQTYSYEVVRQFTIMTIIWGIVGTLIGVTVTAQSFAPALGLSDVGSWFHFGHLRPLHTNAVIFAFGDYGLTGTSYYAIQRTYNTCLFGSWLPALTFWGWQAVIVTAAISLPMGYTQDKEYAELEQPIDILITLVQIAYATVFFGIIAKRKIKHIYVAGWFCGGFILAAALLHIVSNISIPAGLMKSYPVCADAIDAMVQQQYGHDAVDFFLTAGFLGMMYYFVPKQTGRPIYPYRLSVVRFWALIFTYMWAGSHRSHYTVLPNWAQSLDVVLPLILFVPSWGGVINGIMTLSGTWDKLHANLTLKFLTVSLSFYNMSAFEGPTTSIKTVNTLNHYTDWTIAHVHAGTLGWMGSVTIDSVYYTIPCLLGKSEMYSTKLVEAHFWIATIGVVLYIATMWIAGIMQGLMWGSLNDDNTLTYSFVESVERTMLYYMIHFIGGLLYLSGMCIVAYNVYRTAISSKAIDARIPTISQTQHHQ